MKLAGVIGSPIAHSLSPVIHNAAFRASGAEWVYVAFEVAPGQAGAAIDAGAVLLVIVGVVASAIAAFFYIRVIVLMFFTEPAPDGPTVAVPSLWTTVGIGLGVAATIILGIVPGPMLELAQQAATFVR